MSDDFDMQKILEGETKAGYLAPDANVDDILNPPDPDPSPLEGLEYTGNISTDAEAEIRRLQEGYREFQEESEKLRGFKERSRREDERRRLATDSEFWVALCFQDRDQKEAFLKALDLFMLGDKYVDGRVAYERIREVADEAAATGEAPSLPDLPDSAITYRAGKIDPKLADLAHEL